MKQSYPHLIGINCAAHITHNALKKACDSLPIEVQMIVGQIYSHFYIYTVRTEQLKSFCAETHVEYVKLLSYAKTRFLALAPAVKRILDIFDGLKLYFSSLEKGHQSMKAFFNDPQSKFWFSFVLEQAELFAETILKIEGDEVTIIESLQYLEELQNTVRSRKEDKFFSVATSRERQLLIEIGYDSDELDNTCDEFYDDVLAYFKKWLAHLEEQKIFRWALLRSPPKWADVRVVMDRLIEQKLCDDQSSVKVHTQFGFVKNYCTGAKIAEWKEKQVTVTNRWVEVFQHLETENCDYKEFAKMVEYVLCLPATTCSVERVFSSINNTWTDDKSRLKVDTLKSIMMVKSNVDLKCTEFYAYLKQRPMLLKQISSQEKYQKSE